MGSNTESTNTESTSTETTNTFPQLSSHLQELITSPDDSWLYPEDAFFKYSPTREQNATIQQELKLKESMFNFIIKLGSKLHVDGRTILATFIYLHRYYMRLPITSSKYYVASAAFCISCKLNDNYRPPDRISLVSCQIRNPNPQIQIDEQSVIYWKWKDQILMREELILRKLNFDLNLILPYMFKDIFINLKIENCSNLLFFEKRADVFKMTTGLIEVLSALPIIICYNMRCILATCVVITTMEGQTQIGPDLRIPDGFLKNYLNITRDECIKCFKFMRSLLKCSQQSEDQQQISNVKISKRILAIRSEKFIEFIANQD
ncbi:unnamed protein product [Candida verbasci]|uniref:Cyclin-like domain-containing protein n=1 Tax=Candida verbasci TaxID=1227364 RepID=A0A9W4XMZ0_9ASCO|nr:unnamed protein product [Candida verbasci]